MSKEKIPISTHIFMFPFKYEKLELIKENKKNKSKKQDCAGINKSRLNITEIDDMLDTNHWESNDCRIENDFDYGCYMYFYPFVRRAVLGDFEAEESLDECVVKNYKYKFNRGYYCVELKNGKKYELKLNAIKLKLFNTGVGILSFEVENHQEFENYISTFQDILNINEFGRRIYPQFYPVDSAKGIILADKLSIVLYDDKDNKGIIEEDFKSLLSIPEDEEDKKSRKPKDYIYISKTIMEILGKDSFTYSTDIEKDEKVLITPIIDDRMFVISLVNNDMISSVMGKYLETNENWARYIFVDSGDVTIQSDEMLKELIDKHTYKRWEKYKTLYGITRYSFVGVADNSYFSGYTLRNHFRTMYYELVSLALAVRASIISFSDEAASISALKIEKDNVCEEMLVSKIDDLYKRYIEFVNRLYFKEVTAQEQGIELYNMLLKSMNIERDIKDLNEEIEKLYNYATLKSESSTNSKINLLAIFGALLALPTLSTGLFGINIFKEPSGLINWFKSSLGLKWFFAYIILPVYIIYILFRDYLSIDDSIKEIKQSLSKNITTKDKLFFVIIMILFFVFMGYF